MLNPQGDAIANLTYSNWVNKFMFYHTYALSALLVRKHYAGKTTLVTDTFGKELLIDKLELPYDEVIVCLDRLNEYPGEFWALGKIYTYSLFSSPFIHLDFDFLLASPFEPEFTEADLVAYMNENDSNRQKPYRKCVEDYFLNYRVSESIRRYFTDYQNIAYNAGVFGGTETDIFKELWAITKGIIDQNIEQIRTDAVADPRSFYMTNVILEQYLFACLARQKKLTVACLHNNENLLGDDNFWLSQQNLPKYKVHYFPSQHAHMVGHNKGSIDNAILIRHFLRDIDPQRLATIDRLIRTGVI